MTNTNRVLENSSINFIDTSTIRPVYNVLGRWLNTSCAFRCRDLGICVNYVLTRQIGSSHVYCSANQVTFVEPYLASYVVPFHIHVLTTQFGSMLSTHVCVLSDCVAPTCFRNNLNCSFQPGGNVLFT